MFTNDKGEGDPPARFLASIETGLRRLGHHIHVMGTGAMSTKEKWGAVQDHRKREAYIALIRLLHEQPNYKKWFCFDFSDYIQRQSLAVTFNRRHLPLSTGDNFSQFGGLVLDPPAWHQKVVAKSKRKKKTTKSTCSTTTVTTTVQDSDDDDDDDEITIFDPTTGTFVPV